MKKIVLLLSILALASCRLNKKECESYANIYYICEPKYEYIDILPKIQFDKCLDSTVLKTHAFYGYQLHFIDLYTNKKMILKQSAKKYYRLCEVIKVN